MELCHILEWFIAPSKIQLLLSLKSKKNKKERKAHQYGFRSTMLGPSNEPVSKKMGEQFPSLQVLSL